MKKNIFILILCLFSIDYSLCTCVFKLKVTNASKHKASEIVVLNFQNKLPDFMNDSIAIYSFHPQEPTNAMIVLNRNEHWHTFAWMNPEKDTVELLVNFENKNSQIKNPKEWDIVFNTYNQLFNTHDLFKADQYAEKYIEKNKGSYFSLWLINHGVAFHNKPLKRKLFEMLDDNLKSYPEYTAIETDLKTRNVPQVGQAFKEFKLSDIDELAFESNSINDKIIILHFWTNSCKACLKSVNDLVQFQSNLDTSQVKLISICFDTNREDWQKAKTSQKIKWTNLWQSNGVYCDLCLHYDLTVMPLFVVFNRDKKLQSIIEGDALNQLKIEIMKF